MAKRLTITRPRLALRGKGWWYDIREHKWAVILWVLLNLLDFGLTQLGLSVYGGRELNWFLRDLSLPLFALQKLSLAMAAVLWLAVWRWLWLLKWLNLAFVILVGSNIYELIKPI